MTDETGTVVGLLNDTAKCYEGQQSGIGKMGECSKNNAKGYASLTGQPGKKTTIGADSYFHWYYSTVTGADEFK